MNVGKNLLLIGLLLFTGINNTTYKIPDFNCGYEGQMVSGFKNGRPVCSTPAGFIVPSLKCPKATLLLF